jgi:hypothetical protein
MPADRSVSPHRILRFAFVLASSGDVPTLPQAAVLRCQPHPRRAAPMMSAPQDFFVWIYDVYRRAGGRAWGTRGRPVQDAGWQADPSGQDITDGPHWSLYLRPDGTIIGSESTASTPSQHR